MYRICGVIFWVIEIEFIILDDCIFNFILCSIKLVMMVVLCYFEDFVCNDVLYNWKVI